MTKQDAWNTNRQNQFWVKKDKTEYLHTLLCIHITSNLTAFYSRSWFSLYEYWNRYINEGWVKFVSSGNVFKFFFFAKNLSKVSRWNNFGFFFFFFFICEIPLMWKVKINTILCELWKFKSAMYVIIEKTSKHQ